MDDSKERDLQKQYLKSLAESARGRLSFIAAKIAKVRKADDGIAAKAWVTALKAQSKKNSQLVNSVDLFLSRSIDTASIEEIKLFVEQATSAYRDSSVE